MVTLYNFLGGLRQTSEALALQDKRLRTLEKVLHWRSSNGYGAPDPDSPISSCFVDDWQVIRPEDCNDFPKQSIAVVNMWFTNNKHERFHFPSLYTSLRKIKGHVPEDFREVLERFADQVEAVYNYKW